MMHEAWSNIEEVPYCFSRSYVKLQGHTAKKNCRFWPKLGVSGLYLQFEFTDGFELMHKAWCSIEEVQYYFSGSSIKFRGHMGWKIDDSNPIRVRLPGLSQLSNPSDLLSCIVVYCVYSCKMANIDFECENLFWMSNSVHKNRQTHRTFPMTRSKCLKRFNKFEKNI